MSLIRKMRKLNNRSYTVALPREVRELLKLEENDNVEYVIKKNKVILRKSNDDKDKEDINE
ncbi:MAG: AbrB/MazE/SpoVT family DNA-binding domain-containing protein [Clostridium perfringens]|nr:AbrB/MazE/SpoVT family DNA-binding domain-containing protein [Clostridium perfringens]